MREEWTYVLITPYSILKSRTGGILGRLLSTPEVELVGARMLFPSDALVEAFLETLNGSGLAPKLIDLLNTYCRTHLGPNNNLGLPNRLQMLLFRGRDATAALNRRIGSLMEERVHGDTLCGTFGDYLEHKDGRPLYFEPGVLHAPNAETARRQLEVLAQFADNEGGIYQGSLPDLGPDEGEETLVLIKPDSFRKASSRPGQIMDMFSRSGCYLTAMDLMRMSISQAEQFYAPLREQLSQRAQPRLVATLGAALPETLGFRPSQNSINRVAELLKTDQARHEFGAIIKFMTGLDPDLVTDPDEREQPSRVRCLALLYRGHDAIRKVRAILGTHDPRTAADGTVRSEFGFDFMQNGAHASATPEDVARERKIIGIYPEGPSTVVPLIKAYLVRQ